MELTNAHYVYNDNYPTLLVTCDGVPCVVPAEQKPTLIRHGIVFASGLEATAEFNGRAIESATTDPYLFRLVVAFLLACYHDRFEEGPASDDLDIAELEAMGGRLVAYETEDSPPWIEIVSRFWPIRAFAA